MNETKYTKGPWTVEEIDANAWTGRKTYNVKAGAVDIVGMEGLYLSEEEDIANANLIAAAPELLEALREACEAHLSANGTKPPQEWLIAVAKAEGRL